MTAPDWQVRYPPGPLTDQLRAELAAVDQVTSGIKEQMQRLVRRAVMLYLSYVVTTNQVLPEPARAPYRAAMLEAIDRVQANVRDGMRQQIWEALVRALYYGHQTAMSYIPGGSQQLQPDEATLQWVAAVVDATQARLDASLLSARAYAQTRLSGSFEDMMASMMPVSATAQKLERDIRWATNAAYNQGSRSLADAHGLARMWVAERDACLHCLALSGTVAPAGQPFDAGLTFYVGPEGLLKPLPVYPPGALWGPPRHPNCVPAGTVVSGPNVQVGYRRWYTGEMVEIRTQSGHVLAVTPNHPVLTPDGWVPAGQIQAGSHVIRDLGGPSGVGRPDEDQEPAPIEQVFGALGMALGVPPVRMPLTPEDFHGDGTDGQVDVVAAVGFLDDGLEIRQPLHQQPLVGSDHAGALLAGLGSGFEQVLWPRATGYAGASGHRAGHALGGGFGGGDEPIRFGPATDRHTVALQGEGEGAAGLAVSGRELFETRPGQVAADAVVEVRRFPWSGHVYNLQTAGGWYTANGIITHNCRCYAIPVPQLENYPVMPWETGPVTPGDALQREARRSVLRGFSGSDSLPARLRATDALLAVGAGLPRSVEARARAAVRARRYRR